MGTRTNLRVLKDTKATPKDNGRKNCSERYREAWRAKPSYYFFKTKKQGNKIAGTSFNQAPRDADRFLTVTGLERET